MDYAILTLDLPEELADLAGALLHERGALGVEVRDREAVPPGTIPPAPGRAEVLGYFDGDAPVARFAEELTAALGTSAPRVSARVTSCRREDWAESWKAHFPPLRLGGRLWVVPPWVPRPEGPAVVLEPGMAFGTGAHATTALCLEALTELLPARPGASVLDVGCGSGILGIAARELGAGHVVMLDDDPEAVAIARANAAKNGHAEVDVVTTPIGSLRGAFDVVVANILAGTLVELADALVARRAPGAAVLLSGILATQGDEVRDAFVARGLLERERRARDEWVLLWMGV